MFSSTHCSPLPPYIRLVSFCLLSGNQLIAVNGTTGASLWNYTTTDFVASAPALSSDGTVAFVGGVDGLMHAVNIDSGTRKWAYNASQAVWAPPMLNEEIGLICFGSGGAANPYANTHATVHCLDPTTGSRVWKYSVGSSQIQSCPTLDHSNRTLFVGVYDGRLLALNVQTGALKWEAKTGGRVESSPSTYIDMISHREMVVAGSADGFVYAWDVLKGTEVWKTKLGSQVGSSPAVDIDGRIYIGGDPGVFSLNGTTGAVIWEYKTKALVGSSPALLSDGSLVVGGEDGYLYKFR